MPSGARPSTTGSGAWTSPQAGPEIGVPDGARRAARDRPRDLGRPTSSASSRGGPTCSGRSSPSAIAVPFADARAARARPDAVAGLPVRRLGDDGLGARAEQHGDGQRRPGRTVGPRATRCSIFLVHLFGDISSPYLIGEISTWLGTPAVIDSPVGRFFASIGADARRRRAGHDEPDGRDARGGPDAGPRLPLLPARVADTCPEDQERAPAREGGDGPVGRTDD